MVERHENLVVSHYPVRRSPDFGSIGAVVGREVCVKLGDKRYFAMYPDEETAVAAVERLYLHAIRSLGADENADYIGGRSAL